ncbi:MAG TPA: FHA domain-containing protein [Usitatibacter sp.]|nr:FHA domain-containing protein [Usitatibacter sp.]
MGAVMWIEVLARHGEVATRERIDSEEARIGRAFDNDVVVDDPHVAPHHLRVFRADDGELVAEDLGTLNGLYREHGRDRTERLPLASEPGIRIGRTILRVHDARHAVTPERLMTPPRAHARWAAGLGAVLVGGLTVLEWLSATAKPSANLILLPLLGFVTVLALWTGFWSMLSRIFFGQARFALQLRIAVTACIALILWEQVAESLSFSLAWRDMAEYAGLGAWAVLAGACWAHLHAIGPRHMRAAMGLAAALIIAGAALQYLGKSESRKVLGQRATLGDLRPPAFRLVPLASADDFFRKTASAKQRVDVERTREPSGSILSDLDLSD